MTKEEMAGKYTYSELIAQHSLATERHEEQKAIVSMIDEVLSYKLAHDGTVLNVPTRDENAGQDLHHRSINTEDGYTLSLDDSISSSVDYAAIVRDIEAMQTTTNTNVRDIITQILNLFTTRRRYSTKRNNLKITRRG